MKLELEIINDRDPNSPVRLKLGGVYRCDVTMENLEDESFKIQNAVIDAEIMLKEEREVCNGNCTL